MVNSYARIFSFWIHTKLPSLFTYFELFVYNCVLVKYDIMPNPKIQGSFKNIQPLCLSQENTRSFFPVLLYKSLPVLRKGLDWPERYWWPLTVASSNSEKIIWILRKTIQWIQQALLYPPKQTQMSPPLKAVYGNSHYGSICQLIVRSDTEWLQFTLALY